MNTYEKMYDIDKEGEGVILTKSTDYDKWKSWKKLTDG